MRRCFALARGRKVAHAAKILLALRKSPCKMPHTIQVDQAHTCVT